MSAPYQLFAPLPPDIEAALRDSIRRFGVLVPVVVDQDGVFLDGHHRARIADELGVTYDRQTHTCANDDERRAIARTLNADRRQLTADQRKAIVLDLAAETVAVGREEVARYSPEAIAGALGVTPPTVRSDIEELESSFKLTRPAKTLGRDNKVRPTTRPKKEEPEVVAETEPPKPKRNRKPLPDAARSAGWELNKAVERVARIADDDRYPKNADQVATLLRHHLIRSIEALSAVLEKMPTQLEENATR